MTILHKDEHFSCRCSILSEILHPMEVKRILNKEKSVADDFLEKRLQAAERTEDMGGERRIVQRARSLVLKMKSDTVAGKG